MNATEISRLVAHLDHRVAEQGCDCTHRHTVDILSEWGESPDNIAAFLELLRERGGYCDCEVRWNAFPDVWGQIRGSGERRRPRLLWICRYFDRGAEIRTRDL